MSDLEGRPPVTVSEPRFPGKRAGEAGHGLPKAEPTVWTARMLATLAQGVKGGRWHSLIDKLYPIATLRVAPRLRRGMLYRGIGQSRCGRGRSCDHRAIRERFRCEFETSE
jgi:hypothetical protein